MTHVVFGINDPDPKDKLNLTLNPPSTYARRHPLYTHPSEAIVKPFGHTWKFHPHVQWTEEHEIMAKNRPDGVNRTNSSTVGGGGLEWGAWFEFNDKDERITTPSLAFLVDMFLNTPILLPRSEKVGLTSRYIPPCIIYLFSLNSNFSWYPTMVLTLEFKNKIPKPSPKHAARTVGLYSSGYFMTPPNGRHEAYVEVWTAPSSIGEGNPTEDWRDSQICLAIATQMALILPMEVNEKQGGKKTAKL